MAKAGRYPLREFLSGENNSLAATLEVRTVLRLCIGYDLRATCFRWIHIGGRGWQSFVLSKLN